LWILGIFLLLSGCVPASPDHQVTSTPGRGVVLDEGLADSVSPPITPVSPFINPAQDALQTTSKATDTASSFSGASQQAVQTLSAQAIETQAASHALETLSVNLTAAAITPSPGSLIAGSPTATPESLLARFFEPLASFESALPGLLMDMRMSPDGILWAINENGIASLSGSAWRVYFPDVVLRLAGFDEAGRTWIMNEPGTAALSWNGSDWRIYGEGEGWLPIRSPNLFSHGEEMVSDPTGRVWMTAYQDVRSFDGSAWTVHNLREIGFEPSDETAQYDGYSFPTIEKDLQGNIWIGNCDSRGEEILGQGARWFDGARWQGISEPTSSGCVQDIEVDAVGRVWMGIDDLLWRYDPSTKIWTRFELPEPPDDLRIGWIQEIQFGSNGSPWIATALCGGASCGSSFQRYQLQQDKWIPVPQPYDYDPGKLFIDPDGNTWLYSEHEFYRVQGDTLERVLGVEFCCITQDSRGWLYIAAKQGQMKLILVERGGR
jgi:streptogramin lyase